MGGDYASMDIEEVSQAKQMIIQSIQIRFNKGLSIGLVEWLRTLMLMNLCVLPVLDRCGWVDRPVFRRNCDSTGRSGKGWMPSNRSYWRSWLKHRTWNGNQCSGSNWFFEKQEWRLHDSWLIETVSKGRYHLQWLRDLARRKWGYRW